VFERYNVTSGADLKDAAKKVNQFSKTAHRHSCGLHQKWAVPPKRPCSKL